MPIHDQSYRRYKGERAAQGTRWLVIARGGILLMIRRRWFLGLLIGAWVPFLVRCGQIYFSATVPQLSILAVKAETFRDFLDQQGFPVFLITVFAGAGLIAADRRANALQLYLAKPLTRIEYVAGKLAIIAAFLLLVTWIPAILLLIVQMVISGSTQFIRAHAYLFPAITLYAAIQVATASFLMLALSSLSKSAAYVALLYAGASFFSGAVSQLVQLVTGSSSWAWISLNDNVEQLGDVVFRLPTRHESHWVVSLIVICGIIAVSLSVLERRVRPVDIVT
jgi:ABC-2 type transport system permease protein